MSDLPVQLKFTALFKRRVKGLAKKYRQIQSEQANVSAEEIQTAIAEYQTD